MSAEQEPDSETMSLIIVAPNASQRFGGQALLPLQYFRRLRARNLQCWLITHARVRDELVQLLGPDADHVFFVEDSALHRALYRGGRLLPRRVSESTFGLLGTLLTLHSTKAIIRTLIRERGACVVHQPVPVSPRLPSPLYKLGAPVVIGPMNGNMTFPSAFRKQESVATRSFVAAGRMLSAGIHRIVRGKREAAVLLAANERTRQAQPVNPGGVVQIVPENGVDLALWHVRSESEVRYGTFVYVGRLVDWKRVDILLRALKRVPGARLGIVGDGDQREKLEALAAALEVSERTVFHGYQDQAACAREVRTSTALLLSSVYESGGAVVLEAMAVGTPVIVTAWGGPLDYVDAASAILVSVQSEQLMIEQMAAAMTSLMHDPLRAMQISRAGRARVEQEFDWEKKVDTVLAIYREASKRALRSNTV